MSHGKSVGLRFRSLVSLTLQAYNLPAVMRRQAPPGASEGHVGADLEGVARWSVNTRAEVSPRLSAGLDEARVDAEKNGSDFYAVVWPRAGREVDSAYVVTDVRTLARLMKETTLEKAA